MIEIMLDWADILVGSLIFSHADKNQHQCSTCRKLKSAVPLSDWLPA